MNDQGRSANELSDLELDMTLQAADEDLAGGLDRTTDVASGVQVIIMDFQVGSAPLSDLELDAVLGEADDELVSGLAQVNDPRARLEEMKLHPASRGLRDGPSDR